MNSPRCTVRRPLIRCVGLTCLALTVLASARAETPRVLPPGQLPKDSRLGPLKTLNSYFPFKPCDNREAWTKRAERVRRQMLVATGLWPMPTKTPPNAVIHGRIDRGDYTVEKVYLESFPGHFVTGNLYRPKGRTGPGPGVLCPHGHWPNGRFYDAGEKAIVEQIHKGEEKFNPSGRSPLQARCAKLARLGCTVFFYDMVGFADSQQLSHGYGARPEMNTPKDWGYFSPQAELRLQNMMGLQTYNSIRVLDWFSGLPEVDPKRIGVTGASGGGTQTFILCAIDPRPAVAFPAVMVSTAMQGGCTCENCCYLRVGTGNIEISALIAPRPLGMTAADDWTKEIATKGLPELKQLYKLLGVPDLVQAFPFLQFPHNYNYVSRSVMYPWMNKHLALGQKEPIVEEDYRWLSKEELTVWDKTHPKPPSGADYERKLLNWITADSEKQLEALVPKDKTSLAEFRRVVGGAVDVMIGRGLPAAGDVEAAVVGEEKKEGYALVKMLLHYKPAGEEVPAVLLKPNGWNRSVMIWIDKNGKQGLFDEGGKPRARVASTLKEQIAVLGLDLLGQGEFTADGKPIARQRLVGKPDAYAGYSYGYNHSLFAQRVHDILTAIAWVGGPCGAEEVLLNAQAGSGHWAAAARAQAGPAVDNATIDTRGFRFANLKEFDDPDFLPGGAKYFDLPGMLALSAPGTLVVAGEGNELPPVVVAAYGAASAKGRVVNLDPALEEPKGEEAAKPSK
jgi:dienelactone hydrolase